MKERIMKWYKLGLWTEIMVQDAVNKGVITADDMAEIVGEENI
jgi:hypothetical protein